MTKREEEKKDEKKGKNGNGSEFNGWQAIASQGNVESLAIAAQVKPLNKSQGTLYPGDSVSVVQPSCCFVLVHPSPMLNYNLTLLKVKLRLHCFTCHALFCQKLAVAKLLMRQKSVKCINF
jgi:hypothetical protein